jgi:hypothetical protein
MGKKHQYQCGWRDWGKLPMIIWVCRGTGECVGWSTTIILTWRESIVRLNKVNSPNTRSWIYGFKDGQITFKVYAFCEEKGHEIMDCPFVPFHIRTSVAKHVELPNVAWTLMYQPYE